MTNKSENKSNGITVNITGNTPLGTGNTGNSPPRGLLVRVPDWRLSGSVFEAGRAHTV